MLKLNLLLLGFFISTSFAQSININAGKIDVDVALKDLKNYKKAWAKRVKELGNNYVIISNVESMIGKIKTNVKVINGEVFSRHVRYEASPAVKKNFKKIDEIGGQINKNKNGTKAKTMEKYIEEAEKLLNDYKAGKVKGKLSFSIRDFALICVVSNERILDDTGKGVRISQVMWLNEYDLDGPGGLDGFVD